MASGQPTEGVDALRPKHPLPLVGVDLSLFADKVGETTSHTPDGSQGVLNLRIDAILYWKTDEGEEQTRV